MMAKRVKGGKEPGSTHEFGLDIRLDFVCENLMRSLQCKLEKWVKMFAVPEYKDTVMEFFENPERRILVMNQMPSGALACSDDYPTTSKKSKSFYIIKSSPVTIFKEDVGLRASFISGDFSQQSLEFLIEINKQVINELISLEIAAKEWPTTVISEVSKTQEQLSEVLLSIQAQLIGNIRLTTPKDFNQIVENSDKRLPDANNFKLKQFVEYVIVKWSHQISEVLKLDLWHAYKAGIEPPLDVEISIWENRIEQLQSIMEQLKEKLLPSTFQFLKRSKSNYLAAANVMCENVESSLVEAKTVVAFCKPIRKHMDNLKTSSFDNVTQNLGPLMHCVCHLWVFSPYHSIACNIILLLRQISNVLIDMSRTFMGGSHIFQVEPEEGLSKSKQVVETLELFRERYEAHRSAVATYFPPEMEVRQWDFLPHLIFDRFDHFCMRMKRLRSLFGTAVDFYRLDKVDVGGSKGRVYCEKLVEILGEFNEHFQIFSSATYDCTDPEDDSFFADVTTFDKNVLDLEFRLSHVVSQAFDDCHTPEAASKLIIIVSHLLERPYIHADFPCNFRKYVHLISLDVDRVCDQFEDFVLSENIQDKHKVLSDRYPEYSSTILWLQSMISRLKIHLQNILNQDVVPAPVSTHPVVGEDIKSDLIFKIENIIRQFRRHTNRTFREWKKKVVTDIDLCLDQKIFERASEDDETSDIFLHNDNMLNSIIKEVKYLKIAGFEKDIPMAAISLFDQNQIFRRQFRDLNDMCYKHNHVQKQISAEERKILLDRVDLVDFWFAKGVEEVRWRDGELIEEFIHAVQEPLTVLHSQLTTSQENVNRIERLVNRWKNTPLYCRNSGSGLLDFHQQGILNKDGRYKEITETSVEVQKIVTANLELLCKFKTDSNGSGRSSNSIEITEMTDSNKITETTDSMKNARTTASSECQAYLDSINSLIYENLLQAVGVSVGYLIDHTDPNTINSVFVELSMFIGDDGVTFTPGLDDDTEAGFIGQFDFMLDSILHQANLIKPVGKLLPQNDFFYQISQHVEVNNMRDELLSRINSVQDKCFEYTHDLHRFAFIYEDDPYDQIAETIFELATPKQFQHAVSKFETILEEIEKLPHEKTFDGWFRLNMKPYCTGLFEIVKNWNSRFKEHLVQTVITSLADLDGFIKSAEADLLQPLTEGDLAVLINVMGLLQKIKQRTPTTDDMFGPIREYIDLLKNYDYELPEAVFVQLEELPAKWTALKRRGMGLRVQVAPLQALEVSSIRKRIQELDSKQATHRRSFHQLQFFSPSCPFPYYELTMAEKECRAIETEYDEICRAAKLFDVAVPEPKDLRQCRKEIRLAKGLWDYFGIAETTIYCWKMSPFKFLNAEEMDSECKQMSKEIKAMDKDVKLWPLFATLEISIRHIISSLKSVSELQDINIKERHWQELLISISTEPRLVPMLIHKFVHEDSTKFVDLYSLGLHKFEDEVKNVVEKAVKENSIERTLQELGHTWANQHYGFVLHGRTNRKLVKTPEELLELLEENQLQLQNIAMSKFIEFFSDDVHSWQRRLKKADTLLSTLNEVQRQWCNLESIFMASEDVRESLPQDSTRFDAVDLEFQEVLKRFYITTNIFDIIDQASLLPSLQSIQENLSLCEKALTGYLETKRLAFPRFYFVSSADLLEMLSSGNDILNVCRHLNKLFDSISGLAFLQPDEGNSAIMENKLAISMKAKDGELVSLISTVDCSKPVESWLKDLEESMRVTIRNAIIAAVSSYPFEARQKWILRFPAQVSLAGAQIWWSAEVQICFANLESGNESALKEYYKKQVTQLNLLIGLLVGELTGDERQKIMTVCTVDVHSRDVVGKLVHMRIESAQAFQWQCQLRHRLDQKEKVCMANICDAEFRYLHEYLGNTPRLVITPLTDRCYITLTQSLHLVLGGAPAGPAGTGKTETTKDLGRALGVMVYVFNCSEQMDYRSIGNIFKGLAMTGSWGVC